MIAKFASLQRTAIASSALASALCFSPTLRALELGNIEVLSGLNQPFRAVVPLQFDEGESAETLIIDIANNAEAETLGALPNLLGQELNAVISLQGTRVEALITTDLPVKEPHIDVVVRAELGGNKLHRMYPVLLDLPSSHSDNTGAVASTRQTVDTAPMLDTDRRAATSPRPARLAQQFKPATSPIVSGWASTQAVLPLPEAVLLSEVSDEIGVPLYYTTQAPASEQ